MNEAIWTYAVNAAAATSLDLACHEYRMTVSEGRESEHRNEIATKAILRMEEELENLKKAIEKVREKPEILWTYTRY